MSKIVLIGAGGAIFTRNLIQDLLMEPATRDSEFVMMDINAERLHRSAQLCGKIAEALGVPFAPMLTTDLATAVKGADFVITLFRCGTIEHQRLEYAIPAKYGVEQVVGDTLNPGGVFRGLRVLRALFPVVDAMEQFCPGAYLLNYVNPMSMNTIALVRRAKTVKVFGLCHSVQGAAGQIAKWLDVDFSRLRYYAAGVNHQAFLLKLEYDGRDLYPELRKLRDKPEIYGTAKVQFEMLRHFGYWVTEGSGHNSEYNPYFRKRADLLEKFCSVTVPSANDPIGWDPVAAGVSGSSLECCRRIQLKTETDLANALAGKQEKPTKPSNEYAPQIIINMVKNSAGTAHLNVMNHGLIPTLPPECAVEVPCLVNGAGIFPCRVPEYPEKLAALNRGMIGVQMLGAEGALNGDRDAIFHAVAADPLTAAVLGLDEIKAMTDELFAALASEIDPRFTR